MNGACMAPEHGWIRSSKVMSTSTKWVFKVLARLNKVLLPRLWDKDLQRLTKMQKLLVAYRYWVTRNAL